MVCGQGKVMMMKINYDWPDNLGKVVLIWSYHRIYFSPFDVNEYTVQFLFQGWRYTKKMEERQLK